MIIEFIFLRKEFEANVTQTSSNLTVIFDGMLVKFPQLRNDMIKVSDDKGPAIHYSGNRHNYISFILRVQKQLMASTKKRKGSSLEKLKRTVEQLTRDIDPVGTIKV